jgi:aryl-alcohol dehydrogenase-like predicted oxidoreductase
MAQGVLTGKYVAGQAAPAASRFTGEDGELKSDNRYLTEDILIRVQQLKPLAADGDLSMPALAVAWVPQNPNVSAAIVGASRPDQLIDTATAAGVKLGPALLARVDDIMDPVVERDPAKVESFTTRP